MHMPEADLGCHNSLRGRHLMHTGSKPQASRTCARCAAHVPSGAAAGGSRCLSLPVGVRIELLRRYGNAVQQELKRLWGAWVAMRSTPRACTPVCTLADGSDLLGGEQAGWQPGQGT
jgi:hypothetical protein